MDWAIDQLGKLIQASEPGFYSYALVCPTCSEPVRRRAGPERRAHFAHYSYSAKPECEFYHPSLAGVITKTSQVLGTAQSLSRSPLSQGGLFLERTESGDYSLYVKLPQLLTNNDRVGEMEIRSGFGVRVYTGAQLERARYVRVMPCLPLAEAIGSGDLAMLAMTVKLHISRFRDSNNVFHANEESGRLLAPDEPLEWGERYRIVTLYSRGSTPTGSKVKIELGAARSGWHYYEIGLPTFEEVGDKSQRDAISQYLARAIIGPRARVYFVHPPAHHVEPDGTYVFPETTESIILRRTGGNLTKITISTGDKRVTKVSDLNHDWCEISGLEHGDFSINIDGHEALLGRLEECDLFHPAGVRLSIDGQTWDLFDSGLRDALVPRFQENLRVDCPSVRVAEHLAIENNSAVSEGRTLIITKAPWILFLDGQNFGALTSDETETPEIVRGIHDPQMLARRVWLEGLVARLSGPDAVVRFRAQWSYAAPLHVIGNSIETITWLQPHIQLARSQ